MKINRNAAALSFLVALAGLIGGIWFNFYSVGCYDRAFWSGLCIGIFTSGFLSFLISLNSYFSIRKDLFLKLNGLVFIIDGNLNSPLWLDDNYLHDNIRKLRKYRKNHRQIQEIIRDFKTFCSFGYIFWQVKDVCDLIGQIEKFAYVWYQADTENVDKQKELIMKAKEIYTENAAEFQSLCKHYLHHLSDFKGEEDLLRSMYPLAKANHQIRTLHFWHSNIKQKIQRKRTQLGE